VIWMGSHRGVNKIFKTLASLANRSVFSLAKSENNRPNKCIKRVSERGKKTLARLASEFVFLLANLEFYLHLASWRAIIRTPGSQVPGCRRLAACEGLQRCLAA
jgi:hypothetical protein